MRDTPTTASWIHGRSDAAPGWAGVAELAPDVFATFSGMERELGALVPADVMQLCNARMAMLLGAPVPDAPAAPERFAEPAGGRRRRGSARATAPSSSSPEQFVIDVTGITDRDVDRLLEHVTPAEAVGFVNALWYFEGVLRLRRVLAVDTPVAEEV